ncbi:MAG TPA: hypothetical protein VKP65_25895 [Rhodothermales bacterium]|nr:hypothetical protein [Rhodothermales bacterium]
MPEEERLDDRPDRALLDDPLDPDELRVVLRLPDDERPEDRTLPDEPLDRVVLRVVLRPLEVPDELRVLLRVVLRVPEEVRPDEDRSTPRVWVRLELDERPTVPREVRPLERLVTPAPRVRSTVRLAEPVLAPLRDTVRVRPSS